MTLRVEADLADLLGEAGIARAEDRGAGCVRPVRLRGETVVVDGRSGAVVSRYGSADELDGHTYVRCGNRRASACPSCSKEYKGDAWHLLVCGLVGGKGIPQHVAERQCTFATLTAPSFGAVHGVRGRGPCRARRDKPLCAHGRPAWCNRRHSPEDEQVGMPLCFKYYDYAAHVLWQWHAPELWRRFTIALQRRLAQMSGLTVKTFRKRCRISYSKVVEFQARGVVHIHAPVRLDGSEGPNGAAADVDLDTADLNDAIRAAAGGVRLEVTLRDGTRPVLAWGEQVDCRTITGEASREGAATGGETAVDGRANGGRKRGLVPVHPGAAPHFPS